MAKKFEPIQHYKLDKKGNFVLDDKGCKKAIDLYKGTTFEEMVNFLKDNGTEADKAGFKEACHLKKVYVEVVGRKGGKLKKPTGETTYSDDINVMYAKEWFFKEFAPEYLPVAKQKENKKSMEDMLAEL